LRQRHAHTEREEDDEKAGGEPRPAPSCCVETAPHALLPQPLENSHHRRAPLSGKYGLRTLARRDEARQKGPAMSSAEGLAGPPVRSLARPAPIDIVK